MIDDSNRAYFRPSVYRMYSGPQLSKNQVALLRYQSWNSVIIINFIDGRDIQKVDEIQLLPGNHKVQVGYSNSVRRSRNDKLINFTAEAGHIYGISFSTDSGFTWWDAWIEDISNKLR